MGTQHEFSTLPTTILNSGLDPCDRSPFASVGPGEGALFLPHRSKPLCTFSKCEPPHPLPRGGVELTRTKSGSALCQGMTVLTCMWGGRWERRFPCEAGVRTGVLLYGDWFSRRARLRVVEIFIFCGTKDGHVSASIGPNQLNINYQREVCHS